MKFLLDENADIRLIAFLREQGHDATSIPENHPKSLPDEEVLAIALRERRILITNDRDFGELIVHRKLPHAGVIYFRLHTTALASKIDRLSYVLKEHSSQLREFLVVTEAIVRTAQQEPGL
jgi:predicted nuclease of predicted toxin-antitoxin system